MLLKMQRFYILSATSRFFAWSWFGGEAEGGTGEAVGLLIALARQPAQVDFGKVGEQGLGLGDQGEQSGDRGMLLAAHMTNDEIAVAEHQQPPCPGGRGEAQAVAEGKQFGLVIAPVAGRSEGLAAAVAGRPLEEQTEADAAGIGQGGSIHP